MKANAISVPMSLGNITHWDVGSHMHTTLPSRQQESLMEYCTPRVGIALHMEEQIPGSLCPRSTVRRPIILRYVDLIVVHLVTAVLC
jgi:hypothetical protein